MSHCRGRSRKLRKRLHPLRTLGIRCDLVDDHHLSRRQRFFQRLVRGKRLRLGQQDVKPHHRSAVSHQGIGEFGQKRS